MATPRDIIDKAVLVTTDTANRMADAVRSVLVQAKGPLPDWPSSAAEQREKDAYLRDAMKVTANRDYLTGPFTGVRIANGTSGIVQGLNAAAYPTPDPQVRFNVEIVENGYVVNSGTKTYICEDINKVGERVIALLAARQMDKL